MLEASARVVPCVQEALPEATQEEKKEHDWENAKWDAPAVVAKEEMKDGEVRKLMSKWTEFCTSTAVVCEDTSTHSAVSAVLWSNPKYLVIGLGERIHQISGKKQLGGLWRRSFARKGVIYKMQSVEGLVNVCGTDPLHSSDRASTSGPKRVQWTHLARRRAGG